MDCNKTLYGLSGPKAVPTTLSVKHPETFYFRGSIRYWGFMKKTMQRCFDSLVVTDVNPRGVIIALPSHCSQNEVERMVDILFSDFPVSSVFLINPWMAVMMNANRRTAVIVYVEEAATTVVSVVDMKVEPDAVSHIPSGARDLSENLTSGVTRFIEQIHAVCHVLLATAFQSRPTFYRLSTLPSCAAGRRSDRISCSI